MSLSFLALQESDSRARSPVGFHTDWDSLDHCQHPRPPWGLATAAFDPGSSHACFLCLVHPLPTVWSLLSRGFRIISPQSWPHMSLDFSLQRQPIQTLLPNAMRLWVQAQKGAGVGQRCPLCPGWWAWPHKQRHPSHPTQPASYISSYQDTLS